MNSWMAGIITVDAKSGRVSRSMNWVMDLADLTSSSRLLLQRRVAARVGLVVRRDDARVGARASNWASGCEMYWSSFLEAASFLGRALIM